ncbi:hypothetical protein EMIHUDRAFT_448739 [Emiliania huxleyi CCMP1516]|uniref:Small ribosomal subunit protein mS29 n=2 Tax=Emiliania huxleyi TaxID=2903 RepID=A0A0D3KZV5_EMIH1|nr:hypothetical protein EMIHUDRAFT_448739 [Emiliania huxleyi CCMP1516]EOD41290.1 hypothetical protein EMIHUDRAFT_448739 [Emiliania huxleyi CCMP1516]|eukprot:XP_005793719.1 hypothetical protein EMIHUDRAFT_448739 [Emiliania huxleyi CCMP1516]
MLARTSRGMLRSAHVPWRHARGDALPNVEVNAASWARATARRLSTASPRPVLQSARVTDVAAPQDLKGKAALQEEGSVLLTERELQYRALQPPKGGVEADLRGLMASSDEPLSHTAADAGKIFSLERSSAFASLFFHTGLCGKGRQEQAAKTAAALVRPEVLELRDELLWRAARPADAQHSLRDSSGLVLVGERGHGKSWALNYAAAACEAAGWLVVLAPWAADWTMGVGARSAQEANEAYRVGDSDYFKAVPPELAGSDLYESPDASALLLQSGEERRKAYAHLAAGREPTLADMLLPSVRGEGDAFTDFPVPLRPVHDLLQELKLVTEMPAPPPPACRAILLHGERRRQNAPPNK